MSSMNRKYYKVDLEQELKIGSTDQSLRRSEDWRFSDYESIHVFGDQRHFSLSGGELMTAFLTNFSGNGLLVDVVSSQKRRNKLLSELDQELDILKTFGLLKYDRDKIATIANWIDRVKTWEYWFFSIFEADREPTLKKIAMNGQLYDINSDWIKEYTILDVAINYDSGYFQVTCNDSGLFDEFMMFQSAFFPEHRRVN